MKKIVLIFLFILLIIFSFTGCHTPLVNIGTPFLVSEQETIEPGGTITIEDKNKIWSVDDIQKGTERFNRWLGEIYSYLGTNNDERDVKENTFSDAVMAFPFLEIFFPPIFNGNFCVSFGYASDPWIGLPLKLKKKIDEFKGIYYVPNNVALVSLEVVPYYWDPKELANYCVKKINYPKYLNLNKTKAKIGDTITITSSKPFFDPETFSNEKIRGLLNDTNYYLVWISADFSEYKKMHFQKVARGGKMLYQITVNGKLPVPKEYYEEITPTSVSFKIPPTAKSGEIHVLNEGCVKELHYWISEVPKLHPERKAKALQCINLDWKSESEVIFFASNELIIE